MLEKWRKNRTCPPPQVLPSLIKVSLQKCSLSGKSVTSECSSLWVRSCVQVNSQVPLAFQLTFCYKCGSCLVGSSSRHSDKRNVENVSASRRIGLLSWPDTWMTWTLRRHIVFSPFFLSFLLKSFATMGFQWEELFTIQNTSILLWSVTRVLRHRVEGRRWIKFLFIKLICKYCANINTS